MFALILHRHQHGLQTSDGILVQKLVKSHHGAIYRSTTARLILPVRTVHDLLVPTTLLSFTMSSDHQAYTSLPGTIDSQQMCGDVTAGLVSSEWYAPSSVCLASQGNLPVPMRRLLVCLSTSRAMLMVRSVAITILTQHRSRLQLSKVNHGQYTPEPLYPTFPPPPFRFSNSTHSLSTINFRLSHRTSKTQPVHGVVRALSATAQTT